MSSKNRRGMASIETVFVLVTFVVATFVFTKLGALVIATFFSDGNQLQALPFH